MTGILWVVNSKSLRHANKSFIGSSSYFWASRERHPAENEKNDVSQKYTNLFATVTFNSPI